MLDFTIQLKTLLTFNLFRTHFSDSNVWSNGLKSAEVQGYLLLVASNSRSSRSRLTVYRL